MGAARVYPGILLASLLSACGGGGGSDDGQLTLYTPRVTVSGLATGENVSFTLAGEAFVAATNSTYAYSGQLSGSYTASVTANPAGKTCLFNGSTANYNGSATSLPLVCGTGTGGGGGGGGGVGASPLEGPFQVQGWGWNDYSSVLRAKMSVLSSENQPLTGATVDNFSFDIDGVDIKYDPEERLYVQPITVGTPLVQASVSIDISSSFSGTDIQTMQAAVKDFAALTDSTRELRLVAFDDVPVELTDYSGDVATLEAAIDSIPVTGRTFATDLYGAAVDAVTQGTLLADALRFSIIITDGGHNFDSKSYSDYSDTLDFHRFFVVFIGSEDNTSALTTLEELVKAGNSSDFSQRLIRIDDASQLGAALSQIDAYADAFAASLHHLWYVPARRTADTFTFTYSVLDQAGCVSTIAACGWYRDDIDASGLTNRDDIIYFFPNAVRPAPGDVVRFQIPADWPTCAHTPDYQWSTSAIQGSATGSVVAGSNNLAYDVTLGPEAVVQFQVLVTDTASSCTGVTTMTTD